MKKGYTLIELLVVTVMLSAAFTLVFSLIKVGSSGSGYKLQDLFLPEPSKAKYQREMVEELRRANDLKERENNERN